MSQKLLCGVRNKGKKSASRLLRQPIVIAREGLVNHADKFVICALNKVAETDLRFGVEFGEGEAGA